MENKQVKNLKIGNNTVKVVVSKTIKVSRADEDMDKRVTAAVKSAIYKANVCEKPIAKYNLRTKKAYVEKANGEKQYVL